jgi:IMP dehydrogenase
MTRASNERYGSGQGKSGLRSGMGYAGAATLQDLRQRTKLVRITHAGLIKSHPHDMIITKEAPNYQVNQ